MPALLSHREAIPRQRKAALLKCPTGPYYIPSIRSTKALSLVVPTFQEAGNIERFLVDLCAVLDRELPRTYEVIVVDDNSPDGTCSIAASLSRDLPAIRVIRRIGERGLATAVARGYQASCGEILGTINADFQHPPSVLAAMVDRAREFDIVVASRFCAGASTGDWQRSRLLISRGACAAGKVMLPGPFQQLTDPLSGCYLFRRTVMESIVMTPVGFKTLIEILARGRASRVTECPYEMRARETGVSKATAFTWLSYMLQLRRLQNPNGL